MSKKTFLQGAVILGGAGLIIKVLGAFFRIPLANIIGDTGMGYYQTAYPVYVLLLPRLCSIPSPVLPWIWNPDYNRGSHMDDGLLMDSYR